jgi:hypothetical protein
MRGGTGGFLVGTRITATGNLRKRHSGKLTGSFEIDGGVLAERQLPGRPVVRYRHAHDAFPDGCRMK